MTLKSNMTLSFPIFRINHVRIYSAGHFAAGIGLYVENRENRYTERMAISGDDRLHAGGRTGGDILLRGVKSTASTFPSFAGGFQGKNGAIFTRYLSTAGC